MKSSIKTAATIFVAVAAAFFTTSTMKQQIKNQFSKSPIIRTSEKEIFMPRPTPTPAPEELLYDNLLDDYKITYTVIEYEYLGTYFITAYSPSECGWNGDPDNLAGWITASGTVCHRANYEDRLLQPTTCAVDPNLHGIYGTEYFYIEEFDRVFVAEDTGPGVKGKHLDLFYEDYEDVLSFPTGYYTVYAVSYTEETISAKEN